LQHRNNELPEIELQQRYKQKMAEERNQNGKHSSKDLLVIAG
jgi:hypothetical protein